VDLRSGVPHDLAPTGWDPYPAGGPISLTLMGGSMMDDF
jgi:hypothetical protein